MTKQEMFTKVWLGFEGQNWERSMHGRSCYYRKNGLKCAVGHLIPDEKYKPIFMEGFPVWELLSNDSCLFGFSLSKEEETFVAEMQTAHDSLLLPSPLEDERSNIGDVSQRTLKNIFAKLAEYHHLAIPGEP